MQHVELQKGIVIGMYLIKTLKETMSTGDAKSLCGPEIGEHVSVFVTCVHDTFHTYINPRMLKKTEDSVLFEYTDEYGNFNLKEVDGVLAELVEREIGHMGEV